MSGKGRKASTYKFALDIDTEKTSLKYRINKQSHPEDLLSSVSEGRSNSRSTTKLTDLNSDQKGTPETVSFLDESKKSHVCQVSMIDFASGMNVNLLRYNCYWCRHPFDTRPIGCPIRYVSSQITVTYISQISKDTYTIREQLTKKEREDVISATSKGGELASSDGDRTSASSSSGNGGDQVVVSEKEYYETDGVFCSFNCCKAFINDNKHNRMYDNSESLLTKMYNEFMGTKACVIIPAPSWRLLEQYGGNRNIIKFRNGFNKIEYEEHGNTKRVPKFVPLGILFEEKINF